MIVGAVGVVGAVELSAVWVLHPAESDRGHQDKRKKVLHTISMAGIDGRGNKKAI